MAIGALAGSCLLGAEPAAVRAKIPFDFVAGDENVPAGTYELSRTWTPRTVRISSFDTRTNLAVLHTSGGTKNRTGYASALVFNKYGNQYFLREIWIAGETACAQLPRSRTEKELSARTQGLTREVLAASIAH